MTERKFTNELKQIFDYIHTTLLKEYECGKIPTQYFIISVLENPSSVAYKILSKIMLQDTIDNAKIHFYSWISTNIRKMGEKTEYDNTFNTCIQKSKDIARTHKSKSINSGQVFLSILSECPLIYGYFKSHGVTLTQVNSQVVEETKFIIEEERRENDNKTTKGVPVKHLKKPKKEDTEEEPIKIIDTSEFVSRLTSGVLDNIGECERNFINLNEKAKNGEIEIIYHNEKIYQEIFNTLSKKNKNNVVIVGKSGVGKTETVKHLANLIVNGNVPKVFQDKILLEVDFNILFSGTGMRGAFETKMKSILNDARKKGRYIFFIDSISSVLNSKFNETDVETFIETVMKDKDIMLICTCSEKGYIKEISDYPEWERFFEKVTLDEIGSNECVDILRKHGEKLECFHNIRYEEDTYETCMKLSKRYITERNLPDSAIDILDMVGAKASLQEIENDNIRIAREKISKIKQEIEKLKYSTSKKDYNKMDELEKEQIELQSILDFAIKNYNLEKKPYVVTSSDIKECISEKTNIPLNELTNDDKEKLKGLNDRVKKVVIGQDEAVDEVCKAVKRQRVGIANPNKPVVLFFGGSSGVGKTHLAKTISKELFGNENNIIRLDMSEYSESTSVTKIFGAPPSYVGYGDGGSLADRLRKNKHCILLLDEIEKACDKVYNVFLQIFDEGRLTDSKGNIVDCKNMIIIMTSNIGSKESDDRGNGIGFVRDNSKFTTEIIKKELKNKFRPEFINRIDKIVYFNKLTDENLRKIVLLELTKLNNRIEDMGYHIEFDEETIDFIFNIAKEEGKLGARPILRIIQSEVEDKITDYIIDNDINTNERIDFKRLRGL